MTGTELRIVDFHGDQIVTFEAGGLRFVAMRRIVENIGLEWARQATKLQDAVDKFNCVHMPTVGADGKQRDMLSMPLEKLPLWLATINPNKIKDEVIRTKIESYQAESAIALHDYWSKGAAIRGDLDGIVTGLDRKVMDAIGGMMKGILRKQLSEAIPAMVEAEVLKSQFGTTRDAITAGQVADLAKVPVKRPKGLSSMISHGMRRYCAKIGVAPREGCLGSSRAYVFPISVAREWLDKEGREMIRRYQDTRAGQMSLKLVK